MSRTHPGRAGPRAERMCQHIAGARFMGLGTSVRGTKYSQLQYLARSHFIRLQVVDGPQFGDLQLSRHRRQLEERDFADGLAEQGAADG